MYGMAEYDNTADISYAINNLLPKFKQEKLQDKYNETIEKIKMKSHISINRNKILLCDSVILRCVDKLHLGETHTFGNHKTISTSEIRKTTYNKEQTITSCRIERQKPIEEIATYSPEEKLMLYILVSTYLKRIKNKHMLLSDNLTYIDLKDIHFLFGNSAEPKSNQKDKYINIINMFIHDNIKIYIGDDKHDNGNCDTFTKWFSYIKEIYDYYGNIIGYVYTFGKLGSRFFSSTNYPTRYIPYNQLSISNRNYKQFEIARYLIYNITDRRKTIDIKTIMNDLFDYKNGKSYIDELTEQSNPGNIKYLKSFLNSLTSVLNNIKEMFMIKLYYDEEEVTDTQIYANMKDYNKLYIKISSRTE